MRKVVELLLILRSSERFYMFVVQDSTLNDFIHHFIIQFVFFLHVQLTRTVSSTWWSNKVWSHKINYFWSKNWLSSSRLTLMKVKRTTSLHPFLVVHCQTSSTQVFVHGSTSSDGFQFVSLAKIRSEVNIDVLLIRPRWGVCFRGGDDLTG